MNNWIEHDGGERPVPDETKVIVKFRNGETTICPDSAWIWWWKWGRDSIDDADIVAYRIVE